MFLSVAARQAAKTKRLETANETSADAKLDNVSSDNVKSNDNSTCAPAAAEDIKPEFSYKLPSALEGLPNLPPSVLPPPADAFAGELPQWG